MAGNITVSPDQVLQIASNIERLNIDLDNALTRSQATVRGLASSWQGEAADATIGAFDAFYNKYADDYHEMMQGYVTFLRRNVSESYADAEKKNTGLAGAFK
jgi:WXG100 family type VII secretion target